MVSVALKAQVAQLVEQRRELLVQPCKVAQVLVAHLEVLSMVVALTGVEIMQPLLLEAEAQDITVVVVQALQAQHQTMAVLVAAAQVILARQQQL
jgi:hypothetical protein